jgi:hypothetical protein
VRNHPHSAREKRGFQREKQKNNPGNISSRKSPTLFQQAPKKFKYSAPQKKTCLPGEGKDREKDPCTRIGGYCFIGCMWIGACDGRWWPYSIL